MKFFKLVVIFSIVSVSGPCFSQTLKDAYRDYWYTGVSVNQWQVEADQTGTNAHDVTGHISNDQTKDWPVIVENFNWVVAENCMKCEVVHPQEGVYDFTLADQFVNKARAAGMKILGHALVWHSQCAPWFHYDKDGKLVSKEVLKKRMREHIYTIVSHFRGRVDAWDVVNEAFEDDGTPRKSLFYEILGTDYIPLAFQYAHEADPNVELYYNDFSMNKPTKVEGVARFFRPPRRLRPWAFPRSSPSWISPYCPTLMVLPAPTSATALPIALRWTLSLRASARRRRLSWNSSG